MMLLRISFNPSARWSRINANSTITNGPNFMRLVDDVFTNWISLNVKAGRRG